MMIVIHTHGARSHYSEQVIAGTDCGFATFSGALTVDPDITWAKLTAMVEGAQIASGLLWLSS